MEMRAKVEVGGGGWGVLGELVTSWCVFKICLKICFNVPSTVHGLTSGQGRERESLLGEREKGERERVFSAFLATERESSGERGGGEGERVFLAREGGEGERERVFLVR